MSDKFLVLDDSSTIHKVIELAFPSDVVEVVSAENYAVAKDQLKKVSPSLIFADVGLLQEKDFYLELKEMVANTPVIVLVGSYDSVSEESLQNAGYVDFLKKPFDGGTLLEAVKRAYPSFSLDKKENDNFNAGLDIGLDLDFVASKVEDSVSTAFSLDLDEPSSPVTTSMEENSGLLTPILEKNMESWVKKAVSEYCELHFTQIAKRAIQTELEGLLSEKERLLKENA